VDENEALKEDEGAISKPSSWPKSRRVRIRKTGSWRSKITKAMEKTRTKTRTKRKMARRRR